MQFNDNMIRALKERRGAVGITSEEKGGKKKFGAHAIQNSKVKKFSKKLKTFEKSLCFLHDVFV